MQAGAAPNPNSPTKPHQRGDGGRRPSSTSRPSRRSRTTTAATGPPADPAMTRPWTTSSSSSRPRATAPTVQEFDFPLLRGELRADQGHAEPNGTSTPRAPSSSATPSTPGALRGRPLGRSSRSISSSHTEGCRPTATRAAATPPTSRASPPGRRPDAAGHLRLRGQGAQREAAGASAVVIMNEGQPGRNGLLNMIGDATGLTIPQSSRPSTPAPTSRAPRARPSR